MRSTRPALLLGRCRGRGRSRRLARAGRRRRRRRCCAEGASLASGRTASCRRRRRRGRVTLRGRGRLAVELPDLELRAAVLLTVLLVVVRDERLRRTEADGRNAGALDALPLEPLRDRVRSILRQLLVVIERPLVVGVALDA